MKVGNTCRPGAARRAVGGVGARLGLVSQPGRGGRVAPRGAAWVRPGGSGMGPLGLEVRARSVGPAARFTPPRPAWLESEPLLLLLLRSLSDRPAVSQSVSSAVALNRRRVASRRVARSASSGRCGPAPLAPP